MDYEQKYKEALGRAKGELRVCGSQDCDAARQIFRIFPELKDSEEEKIRKAIICGMNALKNNQKKKTFADIPLDDCIAWLEKQGHMLHPDRVIEWLECEAFQGWSEPIDIRPIIRKFKKDFGL